MLFDPCSNCGCPAASTPCNVPVSNLTLSYEIRTGAGNADGTIAMAKHPTQNAWYTGAITFPNFTQSAVWLICNPSIDTGPLVEIRTVPTGGIACPVAAFDRVTFTTSPFLVEFVPNPSHANNCGFQLLVVTL